MGSFLNETQMVYKNLYISSPVEKNQKSDQASSTKAVYLDDEGNSNEDSVQCSLYNKSTSTKTHSNRHTMMHSGKITTLFWTY